MQQEHNTQQKTPFIWGVAGAAQQVEGAWNEDGKSPSIWDTFAGKKGKTFQGHHGREACDFYHRYASDIALLKQMGIPNFRFSLSWSRILPNGTGSINHKGLDFYKRVLDCLLENNIAPWITLYHWDLPQILEDKGGWTNRAVLGWFEEFCSKAVKELGDRINHWMVLNEPMVFTGAGYFLGYHAPGRRRFVNFLPAMHHATLAMGVGGRVIRHLQPHANIGTTFSCSLVEPHSSKEKDLQAASRVDALLNRLYIEPVCGMGYPLDALPRLIPVEKHMRWGDEALMPFDFDFIGVQNYTREVVAHSWLVPYINARLVHPKKRGKVFTEMNWEVYPPAIYQMLKKFSNYPAIKKLMVTENGAAFPDVLHHGKIHDAQRTAYLQDHITQVLRAKSEGIPVEGYFVWTFTDNFEWAEGYRPRFGLVYVDFETQQRFVKDSGHWYGNFIAQYKQDQDNAMHTAIEQPGVLER